MKESEIRFKVELDEQNVPEKIFWTATDGPSAGLEEAKAVAVSIWDKNQRQSLRINLWGKEMPVDEMKHFCIDTIGGIANTLLSATDDEFMAKEIHALCRRLADHVAETEKQGK